VKETTHTTTAQRQWALRKAASERPHFKVVDGKIAAYTVAAPPALEFVVCHLEPLESRRKCLFV
jgi:hypothetical protein